MRSNQSVISRICLKSWMQIVSITHPTSHYDPAVCSGSWMRAWPHPWTESRNDMLVVFHRRVWFISLWLHDDQSPICIWFGHKWTQMSEVNICAACSKENASSNKPLPESWQFLTLLEETLSAEWKGFVITNTNKMSKDNETTKMSGKTNLCRNPVGVGRSAFPLSMFYQSPGGRCRL